MNKERAKEKLKQGFKVSHNFMFEDVLYLTGDASGKYVSCITKTDSLNYTSAIWDRLFSSIIFDEGWYIV